MNIPIHEVTFIDGGAARKPSYVPTAEGKMTAIRVECDRLLDSTTWILQRQQTGSESQKLSGEEYQKMGLVLGRVAGFPGYVRFG